MSDPSVLIRLRRRSRLQRVRWVFRSWREHYQVCRSYHGRIESARIAVRMTWRLLQS